MDTPPTTKNEQSMTAAMESPPVHTPQPLSEYHSVQTPAPHVSGKSSTGKQRSLLHKRSEEWKDKREAIFSPQPQLDRQLLDKSPSSLKVLYHEHESKAAALLQKRKDRNKDPSPPNSVKRRKQTEEFYEEQVDLTQANLDKCRTIEDILQDVFDRGLITTQEYRTHMQDIGSKRGLNNYTLANWMRRATALKQHTNESEGIDWTNAVVELFMAYFKEPEDNYFENTREPKNDEHWKKVVRTEQGSFTAKAPGQVGEKYWDPIGEQYIPQKSSAVSHLVPVNIGFPLAGLAFGLSPEDGHKVIYDPGNGLQTGRMFEDVIDDFRVTFMPVIPITDPIELKFIICEDELMGELVSYSMTPWSAYHEKKLTFASTGRPSLKYIYFHFAITMLKQLKRNPTTAGHLFTKYASHFAEGITTAAPDAGDWYNKSLLQYLAKALGDDQQLSVLFNFAKEKEIGETVATEEIAVHVAAFAAGIEGVDDKLVSETVEGVDDEDDEDDPFV